MADRDSKGRFIKGQTGNPAGRMPKEREVQYRDILVTAVPVEDWHEIIYKAVKQAKQGDATARKWLTDYLVGVPAQKMELTGKDGKTIEVRLVKDDID